MKKHSGLLCTQDMPKLRPSMSEVVKMLMSDEAVDDQNISRPSLLSEFLNLRGQKDKSDMTSKGKSQGVNLSSSSGNITTSYATMTFNSIYE